jgi:hypothetical protein
MRISGMAGRPYMRFSGAGLMLADLLRRLTSVPRLRMRRQVLPVVVAELVAATVVFGATVAEDVVVNVALAAGLVVENLVETIDGLTEDEAVDL